MMRGRQWWVGVAFFLATVLPLSSNWQGSESAVASLPVLKRAGSWTSRRPAVGQQTENFGLCCLSNLIELQSTGPSTYLILRGGWDSDADSGTPGAEHIQGTQEDYYVKEPKWLEENPPDQEKVSNERYLIDTDELVGVGGDKPLFHDPQQCSMWKRGWIDMHNQEVRMASSKDSGTKIAYTGLHVTDRLGVFIHLLAKMSDADWPLGLGGILCGTEEEFQVTEHLSINVRNISTRQLRDEQRTEEGTCARPSQVAKLTKFELTPRQVQNLSVAFQRGRSVILQWHWDPIPFTNTSTECVDLVQMRFNGEELMPRSTLNGVNLLLLENLKCGNHSISLRTVKSPPAGYTKTRYGAWSSSVRVSVLEKAHSSTFETKPNSGRSGERCFSQQWIRRYAPDYLERSELRDVVSRILSNMSHSSAHTLADGNDTAIHTLSSSLHSHYLLLVKTIRRSYDQMLTWRSREEQALAIPSVLEVIQDSDPDLFMEVMGGIDRIKWRLESNSSSSDALCMCNVSKSQFWQWGNATEAHPNMSQLLVSLGTDASPPTALFVSTPQNISPWNDSHCTGELDSQCVLGTTSCERLSGGTRGCFSAQTAHKLPILLNKKCDFYMRDGWCVWGSNCRFLHQGRPGRKALKRAISFTLFQEGYLLGKKRKKAIQASGRDLSEGHTLGLMNSNPNNRMARRAPADRPSRTIMRGSVRSEDASSQSEMEEDGPNFNWIYESLCADHEGWSLTLPRIERLAREILNCQYS